MIYFIRIIIKWINSIFIFPIVECQRLDSRNIIGKSPNVEVPRYKWNMSLLIILLS